MTRWFSGILFIFALSMPAYAETATDYAYSKDDLQQIFSKWKFNMVNTKERAKLEGARVYYGCIYWCVDKDKSKIKVAYTYGESDKTQAEKKAAYAFDSMSGTCAKSPHRKMMTTNDL